MSVVSDATPLISLAAIGALDLLAQLFGNIVIPAAVYHEVVVAGAGKAGAHAVANAAWIRTRAVKNKRAVRALMNSAGLDQGESEALVLAQELNATLLLLDDLAARQIAAPQIFHHRQRRRPSLSQTTRVDPIGSPLPKCADCGRYLPRPTALPPRSEIGRRVTSGGTVVFSN